MKLVSRQERADNAAKLFKEIHFKNGWSKVKFGQQYDALIALGEKPNPDEVDFIMDFGFTNIQCDCCEQFVTRAVDVYPQGNPYYGDGLKNICLECLKKAIGLLT